MSGRIEAENKVQRTIETNILPEVPTYVKEWYDSMVGRGFTMKTCYRYLSMVKLFLYYSKLNAESAITDITPSMLTNYFSHLQYKNSNDETKRMSESYRHTVWFALNNMFKYHQEIGNIDKNYMSIVKPKKGPGDNVKRYQLTADDFKKMVNGIPGENFIIRTRNRAILLTFMFTGMRRSALSQIDIEDINVRRHELSIIDKGEKKHTYKLTPMLEKQLTQWLSIRNKIAKNTNALFVNSRGDRMSGQALYKIVCQSTEKALNVRLSPHKIRAGLCSILYEETHDIEFVRRVIGQANVSTTQRYIVTNEKEKDISAKIMNSLLK